MAAETELERLVIRLVGDSAQYLQTISTATQATVQAARAIQDATENIAKSTQEMGSKVIAEGNLIAVGVEKIIEKFREWGHEAIQAYSAHETATVKLDAIIKANGRNVEATKKEYEEFTDSISQSTQAGKVQVENLLRQAEALGVTGKQAETAVKWALGLEAATDHAAEGAIRFTAAFAKSGDSHGLTRMLRTLNDIKDPTKRAAEAVRLLNADFEVAKALTETTEGVFRKLEKATHGIFAAVGELVADAIKPLIKGITAVDQWFNHLNPILKKTTIVVVGLTGAVAALSTAIELLEGSAIIKTLKAVGTALLAIDPLVLAVVAAFAAVGAAITYHFGGVSKAFDAIGEYLKPVKIWMEEIVAIVTELGKTGISLIVADFRLWYSIAKEILNLLGVDLAKVFQTLIGWARAFGNYVLGTLLKVEYAIKKFREWIDGVKGLQETFEQFKARRIKELWEGIGEEAAAGLNAGLGPTLKEIKKALEPKGVAFWSLETIRAAKEQLFGVAVAAEKTIAVVKKASHPVAVIQKQVGVANAGAGNLGAAVRAVGNAQPHAAAKAQGRAFRGGILFGPKPGEGQVNTREELDKLEKRVYAQIDADPRYSHLSKLEKGKIAKLSAGKELARLHDPDADPSAEPANKSIRIYEPQGSRRILPRPGGAGINNGDVGPKRPRAGGIVVPNTDHLNDADIQLPAGGGGAAGPVSMTDNLLQQILTALTERNKKPTLEVKPVGLS